MKLRLVLRMKFWQEKLCNVGNAGNAVAMIFNNYFLNCDHNSLQLLLKPWTSLFDDIQPTAWKELLTLEFKTAKTGSQSGQPNHSQKYIRGFQSETDKNDDITVQESCINYLRWTLSSEILRESLESGTLFKAWVNISPSSVKNKKTVAKNLSWPTPNQSWFPVEITIWHDSSKKKYLTRCPL